MKKLILWVLILGVAVGGAYLLYDRLAPKAEAEGGGAETQTPETEKEKIEAPDFTVYDKDGNEFKLSDFAGKPVLINFWASWCTYCKAEMPDLDTVYGEYKDKVMFLIVNATDGQRETVETGNQYIADQGYAFPVYYDTDQSAVYAYGATSLPSTVFIDAEGYVYAGYRGALDADAFRENLDAITETATETIAPEAQPSRPG